MPFEMNMLLLLALAAIATLAFVILWVPRNMRWVAAWLVGRALYVEMHREERRRCKALGEDLRRRQMAEWDVELLPVTGRECRECQGD